MKRNEKADLSKSLDEMEGVDSGDPATAPTGMVEEIIRARKKPLGLLNPEEIGLLIGQRDGIPFILDVAVAMLEADPLLDARHYPGDLLSSLIRADQSIWNDRPEYRAALSQLYDRALALPSDDSAAFFDSLGIEDSRRPQ